MKSILLSALSTWSNKIKPEHSAASGNLVIQNKGISCFRHPISSLGSVGRCRVCQVEVQGLPLALVGRCVPFESFGLNTRDCEQINR